MSGLLEAFLESSVRTATPLALAAMGEMLAERSGVINLGAEGAIIAGAFGAAVGASSHGVAGGLLMGIASGVAASLVFVICAVALRADQIIAGTAVTLGALGLTSALHRVAFGAEGVALRLPTLAPIRIPLVCDIPVFGPVFFNQPAPTYAVYVAAAAITWYMYRTRSGLRWRATGESPETVRAAGYLPAQIQGTAVLLGGAFAGLSGATLVLAQVGTFADGMSAGRGFIAIAVVALGRWHPVGVVAASLLFGASTALQYLAQATATTLPYQLFLALPYVLALAVLALGIGRRAAPAALGQRRIES